MDRRTIDFQKLPQSLGNEIGTAWSREVTYTSLDIIVDNQKPVKIRRIPNWTRH